jgi:flagellar basal body rod protein FlgG
LEFFVSGVDVRALGDQEFNDFQTAASRRQLQRGALLLVAEMRHFRGSLEQTANAFDVALYGCFMKFCCKFTQSNFLL